MMVNIHAAKTNLSKLIEKAEAGEEVVIARNGKPVVRLTLVDTAASGVAEAPASASLAPAPDPDVPSWFGALKGQIWISPDFDEPDEELIRLFEDGPIFPPDEPKS
jgi:prevent-host-death family protein